MHSGHLQLIGSRIKCHIIGPYNIIANNMADDIRRPKEANTPPGQMSSIASSSRQEVSASSAPANLHNRRNYSATDNDDQPPQGFRGRRVRDTMHLMQRDLQQSTLDSGESNDSFHSSPLYNNTNKPRRTNRRTAQPLVGLSDPNLERKIRQRRQRQTIQNIKFDHDTNKLSEGGRTKKKEDDGPVKAITDLLVQTALFGLDTTAKLSKPTLQLTKDTLLPQIFIPLFQEIFEQYVPIRLQTWMKVIPTSFSNVGNLLWDTEAGQTLGQKAGKFGEVFVEVTTSDAARQCWIDATIAIIKLMESLHTPEVKVLLDQFAVGACRFVDVLSSGKAKQLWFDASDAVWALIKVGSDPVMVTSLAEGCAQVCFALEHERESLKERRRARGTDVEGGNDSNDRLQKIYASKRRRERDQRQMGTYPPGKAVIGEGEGRDGFTEALLDGLDGHREGEQEFEDYIYGNFEDDMAEDVGPPQRVLVPTSSTDNIEGGGKTADAPDDNRSAHDETNNHQNVGTNADCESEITTEIEDLGGGGRNLIDYNDVDTQSSASEKSNTNRRDNAELAYEQDGRRVEYRTSLQDEVDQFDLIPNDNDGAASEMYDTFDEPILQFYRRMNEVLVETRKQRNVDDLKYTARGGKTSKDDGKFESERNVPSATSIDKDTSPPTAQKGLFGIGKKRWWKFIIIASICGIAAMCMLWFALGCYGFYILVIGSKTQVYQHSLPVMNGVKQPSNVVIQIVAPSRQEVQCDASGANNEVGSKHNRVSTISLDDWNEMKLGVDKAIEQTVGDQKKLEHS